ncbi:MAG: restriction endonuclease subunit S, partial [Pseudomonadota bacterium]|nr:restriction endonuclease subunit S [Pseudomonadota bacterium]
MSSRRMAQGGSLRNRGGLVMAGEWQRHEVSKLIEAGTLLIGDGYRAKNDELGDHGLPFARAGNINDGFQFKDADHFPEGNLARVGNKVSRPGDVVFTSKGTVGRFAFVRPSTQRFVYSPQLCFWRALDASVIEPGFLFYWMFGREFFVQFKGVAGQTDMAEYVSLTDQRRMHITLPPIHEQRAIAHILGTLDDKIELNRRMSETLEAMARALFKAWFVDFEPVRAKHALSKVEGIEGRWQRGQSLPGLPAHLYDLFPDRLV